MNTVVEILLTTYEQMCFERRDYVLLMIDVLNEKH